MGRPRAAGHRSQPARPGLCASAPQPSPRGVPAALCPRPQSLSIPRGSLGSPGGPLPHRLLPWPLEYPDFGSPWPSTVRSLNWMWGVARRELPSSGPGPAPSTQHPLASSLGASLRVPSLMGLTRRPSGKASGHGPEATRARPSLTPGSAGRLIPTGRARPSGQSPLS